jgi:DNA mismatch endonuclease (patch repair protein)
MDVVAAQVRSRMMAGIRGKHTRPELAVRRALSAAQIRYRLHRADLPGKPDVVVPRFGAAIFVHGCFWHAHQNCRFAKLPSTRADFWRDKLGANVARDEDATALLNLLGWRVLVVWECATRTMQAGALEDALRKWLESGSDFDELGEAASRYR